MNIDLAEWVRDLQSRPQTTIRAPVSVVGRHDRNLGPRWEVAEIHIVAEPADHWDVQVLLPEEDRMEMEKDEWLREAILGVLDVLVGGAPDPLLRIRLRVMAVRYTFESSRRAFRVAGRKAAEALLESAEVIVAYAR